MDSVSQDNPSTQMPNCIREAFLGIDAYKTAIVLDLLFTLGYKSGQWITYHEAVAVGTQYTAFHIIREGLKHFTIPQKVLPQSRRGRPTIAYQLPSIDRLKHQLVAEWSRVTDTLQLADFRNAKTYKMALHRELIHRANEENNGGGASFSREFLCERLNISPDTCRRYEKELGIYVEARYQERDIRDRWSLLMIPKERAHNGQWLEVATRKGAIKRVPAIRSLAALYRKQGYDVWLKKRLTNLYHPKYPFVSDEQIQANQKMLRDLFG